MTEHLSDPHEQWPRDPWRLLGVPRDADERTVRRAYSALIRRFRPDDAPVEFQKIREAYEAVRQSFSVPDEWTSLSAVPVRPEDMVSHSPGSRPFSSPQPQPDRQPRRASTEQEPEYWRIARDGDIDAALRMLDGSAGSSPDSEEDALRRYWLLQMSRRHSRSDIVDWLAEHVASKRHHREVFQLLEYDLQQDRKLARRTAVDRLLKSGLPLERVLEIHRLRWQEAGAAGDWNFVSTEFAALRADSTLDDTELLASITLVVLELAVWGGEESQSLVAGLIDRLAGQEELQLKLPHLFDQLEEIESLHDDMRGGLVGTIAHVHALLRAVALETPREVAREVLRMAERLATASPVEMRDLAMTFDRRPVMAYRLWQALIPFNGCRMSSFTDDEVQPLLRLVEYLTATVNWTQNSVDYSPVVEFCRNHGLPLHVLVMLIHSNGSIPAATREIAVGHLYGNITLSVIVEAAQVHHSPLMPTASGLREATV